MHYLQRFWLPLLLGSLALTAVGLLTGFWTGFFFLPLILIFPPFGGRGQNGG